MENEQKSTMSTAIEALEKVMSIVPESERERLQKIIGGLRAAQESDDIQRQIDGVDGEIDLQTGEHIKKARGGQRL